MRAIEFEAYGGPEVLTLREIPSPEPDEGELLIDVHAVSVNPIDWKLRAGRMANVLPLTMPATTGRDGAGIVRAVGPRADLSWIGRRVAFFAPRGRGTWMDEVGLPDSHVAQLPDNVSFLEGAALPLAGTSAWIPLVDIARVGPGARVLIHAGAGGVGSLAIQIAKARGAHVTATCSSRNADFVTALGADAVIAYDHTPIETAAGGFDVVLDTMGGAVHEQSYSLLRRGGLMVCLSAEPFTDRSAEYGVTVTQAPIFPRREILDAMLAMVANGTMRIPIEDVLPFSAFRDAHKRSQTGRVRGKIVLRLRNDDGTTVA